MTTFEKILAVRNKYRAGYWVLLDPDKLNLSDIPDFVKMAEEASVDGFLVGGSLILSSDFNRFVAEVKKISKHIPVILFPGSVHQITPDADALLFLSLISGREAQHLIGSQVLAAPLIYQSGIEAISTAYMLIDTGKQTSAHFMSGTMPLPRNKPDILAAHVLAAHYFGFKLIYLEGGSGSDRTIPDELISAAKQVTNIPLIVGGGIRTPDEARTKVKAGASFIVTGTILENNNDNKLMQEIAYAVHAN